MRIGLGWTDHSQYLIHVPFSRDLGTLTTETAVRHSWACSYV